MTNKDKALNMSFSTANARLTRSILFELVCRFNLNKCFRCGNPIIRIKDLSIEHKLSWLGSDSPKLYFFDLDNIAFSHLLCNISAGGRNNPNSRKDRCIRGHLLKGKNLRIDERGNRRCKKCNALRMRISRNGEKADTLR